MASDVSPAVRVAAMKLLVETGSAKSTEVVEKAIQSQIVFRATSSLGSSGVPASRIGREDLGQRCSKVSRSNSSSRLPFECGASQQWSIEG